MTSPPVHVLALARGAAFGLAGIVLLGLALLVLFGGPDGLRLASWSWVAGIGLFAVVVGLGLLGGSRGRRILWDEAAVADHDRSQRLAYLSAILLIYPGIATAIFAGFDPLRGFVSAALLTGSVQLLSFFVLDRIGR